MRGWAKSCLRAVENSYRCSEMSARQNITHTHQMSQSGLGHFCPCTSVGWLLMASGENGANLPLVAASLGVSYYCDKRRLGNSGAHRGLRSLLRSILTHLERGPWVVLEVFCYWSGESLEAMIGWSLAALANVRKKPPPISSVTRSGNATHIYVMIQELFNAANGGQE